MDYSSCFQNYTNSVLSTNTKVLVTVSKKKTTTTHNYFKQNIKGISYGGE